MDQWTPSNTADDGASDGANDSGSESPSERPMEQEGATEDAVSTPAGGAFVPDAQPIGHPEVEDNEPVPDSGPSEAQRAAGADAGSGAGGESAAPELGQSQSANLGSDLGPGLDPDLASDLASDLGSDLGPDQEAEELGGQGAEERTSDTDEWSPSMRVLVDEAEGDLTIVGGAPRVGLGAAGDRDEVDAVELSDGIRFGSLPDGAELRVPSGALVIVREANGDVQIERVDGEARVSRAQGDVRVEDSRVAQLGWISGDLTVERSQTVEAEGVGGDVWLANVRGAVTLGRVGGDVEARRGAALTVHETIGGDVQIERYEVVDIAGPVGGDVELRRVASAGRLSAMGGDLVASDSREVIAGSIGGDLRVEGIPGRVTCDTVGGDAEITNTFGPVSIGVVGGDLRVERAPGGVSVARVGGDALLDTFLRAEARYVINAGGDVTLRARGEVNARFVAQSFGGEIRTRLPLTVERGRRRNLVGALGSGSATVTLQSGGDITIVAADGERGDYRMGDENINRDAEGNPTDQGANARTFEGAVGGRKFRVRVENAPGRAGFEFKGPFTTEEDAQAREFRLEWERGRGAHTSGEYSEQLNDLRNQAEQLARRAGEEARKYAEMAAKRARETDWESMGREVRTTIEHAMTDLEDAFARVRGEWETRGPSGAPGTADRSTSRPSSGPQRVRIEHDEPVADATDFGASAQTPPVDRDAVRRQTLEDLRNGRITLDEAERRLNDLR